MHKNQQYNHKNLNYSHNYVNTSIKKRFFENKFTNSMSHQQRHENLVKETLSKTIVDKFVR